MIDNSNLIGHDGVHGGHEPDEAQRRLLPRRQAGRVVVVVLLVRRVGRVRFARTLRGSGKLNELFTQPLTQSDFSQPMGYLLDDDAADGGDDLPLATPSRVAALERRLLLDDRDRGRPHRDARHRAQVLWLIDLFGRSVTK